MSVQVDQPTALYRVYGSEGTLLYVGITCSVLERMRRHSEKQPWWTEVSRIDVEWHSSRGSAFAAEELAIRTEAPLRNKQQGNCRRVSKSFRLRRSALEQVVVVCDREGWSFSEAVERALEEWVEKREG